MAQAHRQPRGRKAPEERGRKPKGKPNQRKARANRENGKLGGRPRKPAPPPPVSEEPRLLAGTAVDGVEVADLARLGAAKETILKYLRIPRELLQSEDFIRAFDAEIEYGIAAREIDLLRERRDLATGRAAFGKVSATLAGFRNMGPNWDRVDKDRGGPKLADQQGAIADASKVLEGFRG